MKLRNRLANSFVANRIRLVRRLMRDSTVYIDVIIKVLLRSSFKNLPYLRRVQWEPSLFEPLPLQQQTVSFSFVITCHLYYKDFIPELVRILKNINIPFDLMITTPEVEIYNELVEIRGVLSGYLNNWSFRLVPNRGRNFGPLLVEYGGEIAQNYDYMLHFHSKKSPHTPSLSGWAHFLLENLIPDSEAAKLSIDYFESNPDIGLIMPPYYEHLGHIPDPWGGLREFGDQWLSQKGFAQSKPEFTFPAGGMFWARVKAIEPLLVFPWAYDDFATEDRRSDPTFRTAYVVERLVSIISEQAGYRTLICTKVGFTSDDSFKNRKGVFSDFSKRLLVRNLRP